MGIGCYLKSVCIYQVRPAHDIQVEIDKQTKAKVDARTEIIKMQNTQQISMIEIDTKNQVAIKEAEIKAQVL